MDTTSLAPIRQIPAHELVLDQIRRSLELGQFQPGDRLPTERELSDILKVSRTTVRSALYVLEREGLIDVQRGRGGGFTVQAPTVDPSDLRDQLRKNRKDLRDTFEFREAVEVAAAELAAQRRSAEDIDQLRSLLEQMDRAVSEAVRDQSARNVASFQTLDNEFHMEIANASDNQELMGAVADARRKMWLPVGTVFTRLEDNANDYHEAIVEAIGQQDAPAAGAAMRDHIRGTRHRVEKWLEV